MLCLGTLSLLTCNVSLKPLVSHAFCFATSLIFCLNFFDLNDQIAVRVVPTTENVIVMIAKDPQFFSDGVMWRNVVNICWSILRSCVCFVQLPMRFQPITCICVAGGRSHGAVGAY